MINYIFFALLYQLELDPEFRKNKSLFCSSVMNHTGKRILFEWNPSENEARGVQCSARQGRSGKAGRVS